MAGSARIHQTHHARTLVRLFVRNKVGVRQQAVLEIVYANLSRFAIGY